MCPRRSPRLWFLLLGVGWVSGLLITHRPRVMWGCWVSILTRPRSRVGNRRGISVPHAGFGRGWIRRYRFYGLSWHPGGGCGGGRGGCEGGGSGGIVFMGSAVAGGGSAGGQVHGSVVGVCAGACCGV